MTREPVAGIRPASAGVGTKLVLVAALPLKEGVVKVATARGARGVTVLEVARAALAARLAGLTLHEEPAATEVGQSEPRVPSSPAWPSLQAATALGPGSALPGHRQMVAASLRAGHTREAVQVEPLVLPFTPT